MIPPNTNSLIVIIHRLKFLLTLLLNILVWIHHYVRIAGVLVAGSVLSWLVFIPSRLLVDPMCGFATSETRFLKDISSVGGMEVGSGHSHLQILQPPFTELYQAGWRRRSARGGFITLINNSNDHIII
jgi:hypothetical protein